MAMEIYVPTVWVNETAPSIDSTNLNHIEQGIQDVTAEVIVLTNTKVGSLTGEPGTSSVPNLVRCTQESYDDLTPIPDTLYFVKG